MSELWLVSAHRYPDRESLHSRRAMQANFSGAAVSVCVSTIVFLILTL